MLVDPRSNSLIDASANPARMAPIRALVDKLDRPADSAPARRQCLGRLPEERRRDEARRTVLRAAFSSWVAAAAAAVASLDHDAATPTPQQPAATGSRRRAAAGAAAPISAVGRTLDRRLRAGRPVDQRADHHRAPSRCTGRCAPMIDQLDSRRAQVYIEALIVEVDRATDTADFGIQWQGLLGKQGRHERASARHQLRHRPATS